MTRPLIEAEDVTLAFGARRWPVPREGFRALKGVSVEAWRGETVGIVGESGSGKSTLGRCLLRLADPDAGTVRFDGQDITGASRATLLPLRRRMQMIFQDPLSSLNPRHTVRALLAQPLRLHRPDLDHDARCRALLEDVGLGEEHLRRYPHQLSGGQRQRVGIARALAVEPDFVLADEIVSGLDVSTQAQVLELLRGLGKRLGLTVMFISHDLSVVRRVCERVYVMKDGLVVESGATETLFAAPGAAYTKRLIAAVPPHEPSADWLDRSEETGELGMKIAGARVLVTGANRGVGASFVEALKAKGAAKIYAAARDPATIAAPGVETLALDVTKPDQIAAAAQAASDITLVINNAGINRMTKLIAGGSNDAAAAEMEVNYFGLLNMARAFGPVIKANGGGGMVNMLSVLALTNLPMMGSLAASKAAAYSATQGMRAEWQKDGIQVLAVLPGAIDTDMSRDFPPPKMAPRDVADAALDALEAGEWECYPGDMAQGLRGGVAADPIGVMKDMMQYV